jgi:predicted Zn-dependent protease with MMP-like domain
MHDTQDPQLDAAWAALDEGACEEALELVAELPGSASRRAVEIHALLGLNEPGSARGALEGASEAELDDLDLLWAQAELDLFEWRTAEARVSYERICARDRQPEVLERLALLDDLDGDFEAAERRLAEAHELDADWTRPPRLDTEEFRAALERAIDDLPEEFRGALQETALIVEAMPSRTLMPGDPAIGYPDFPVDVLGLFTGSSHLERSHWEGVGTPNAIHLFQRNIERVSLDREHLILEIRVTLYHELGHLLGFDERGLDEIGLE